MAMEKKSDCLVCNRSVKTVEVRATETVRQVQERLVEQMTLKKPTLMGSKGPVIGSGTFESIAAPLQELTFA